MSCNSILVSADSEKRWVIEMEKNFPAAVDTDLDTPCCVFKVPQSLSETNPEAYAPRRLGLGPYHHLRPELYTLTQRQKLAVVRRGTNEQKLSSRVHEVVKALLERDAAVRACYDHYIDLDATTLSWILAIDGLFLLHYLSTSAEMGDVVGDVIMLENQIPILVLNKIKSLLLRDDDDEEEDKGRRNFPSSTMLPVNHATGDTRLKIEATKDGLNFQILSSSDAGVEDKFCLQFFQERLYDFCKANSPLDVKVMGRFGYDIKGHLLHFLYELIVNNRGDKEQEEVRMALSQSAIEEHLVLDLDTIQTLAQFADDQGVPGAKTVVNVVSFMENAPWEKIKALFNRGHHEQLPPVDEIDVPTVSQMAQIAGITFIPTQGGIRDVVFNEEERSFSLPVITFKPHSEIILRNLVAYEAASAKPGARLELAQYVDLMCGIIDTTNDVEILKKAGIVRGDQMSDAEIARVCNGIKRSTGDGGEARSNIEQAIQNVNKRYDEVWSVKLRRSLNNWFTVSWKVVCTAVAVAVVLLLTVQAFCTAFGCSRWFGTTTVQGSRFLHSYADH